MMKRMDRRTFLARAVVFLAGAASAAGLSGFGKQSRPADKPFPRTSRKKARFSKELAG